MFVIIVIIYRNKINYSIKRVKTVVSNVIIRNVTRISLIFEKSGLM